MREHDAGTETEPRDDVNFMIVRGMIFGGALTIVAGLFALIVAILLTID
jgi:hypothetical protein